MSNSEPPAGLALRHTLRRHQGIIGRIAWSPDGQLLASPSQDHTICIWDTETGTLLHTLQEHTTGVICVAWSPDGKMLASGSRDATIRLWDMESESSIHTFEGHLGDVNGLSWSPNGTLLASGSTDNTIGIWDVQQKTKKCVLEEHLGDINSVAWSSDGRFLASGCDDNAIILWHVENEQVFRKLTGHSGDVNTIAWAPDNQILASGSDDCTIRLWNTEGIPLIVLKGHTSYITSVAFSADNRLLASKSKDNTICLWHCGTWKELCSFHESFSGSLFASLAFHPQEPVLATLGEKGKIIRIWDINYDTLLPDQELSSEKYTAAKVVLVGDTGVGKTGLGWRLAHREFKDHPSTHGQQFWVLDDLRTISEDGTEHEVVLWDLAGQIDYHLTHALFLDNIHLALLVFDASNSHNALKGIDYWLNQLTQLKNDEDCRIILVGARIDRGTPAMTKEELEQYCQVKSICGNYVLTSAFNGEGLETLVNRIREQIIWEKIPSTVPTTMFQQIKNHVFTLKGQHEYRNKVITPNELLARLNTINSDEEIDRDTMMKTVHQLEIHGYIKVLSTSSGDEFILLTPDLLVALASSFVLEARRNERGLGALDEGRVLRGEYRFQELEGLKEQEQYVLLDAVTKIFLERAICFRETSGDKTLLVFPELINQSPTQHEAIPIVEDVSYTISGAIENIYASLVVSLGYTNTFTRADQWQNRAQYAVSEDEICGFRQIKEHEGQIDFVLYYSPQTSQNTRTMFQGMFEKTLNKYGQYVQIRKYQPVDCPNPTCKTRQERSIVVKYVHEGMNTIYCPKCGTKVSLQQKGTELVLSMTEQQAIVREHNQMDMRTKYETALVSLKRFLTSRDKPLREPTCFISYARENAAHSQWIMKFVGDLKNAGIHAISDLTHNAHAGRGIVHFISTHIPDSDFIIVVGTPKYLQKVQNDHPSIGHIVAAEFDLIGQRLVGRNEAKKTVLPVLVKGEEDTALPPLLRGRVFIDFREEQNYLVGLLELVLSIHNIPFDDSSVGDLLYEMRIEAGIDG